jgi:hypothetical protein
MIHRLKENDQDWPRRDRDFDTREPHPSPPARTRSRSPPLRGFRDSRDLQPRDLDLGRVRRDSKDAPLSATSTASDPATSTSGDFLVVVSEVVAEVIGTSGAEEEVLSWTTEMVFGRGVGPSMGRRS